jgi:pimeloyl-ACP methyl ester carboxylesterase
MWSPQRQAGLLRKALETLGMRRPVVVRHSRGTLVDLALALDPPETVSGLVLLFPYGLPTRPQQIRAEAQIPPRSFRQWPRCSAAFGSCPRLS